jgi:hypothetical protein
MVSLGQRLPRLRRYSILILVLGAAVVYFSFLQPHMPRDHEVTLRLEGGEAGIQRLAIAWCRTAGCTDPVGGTTLHFASGAPRTVHTKVRAPHGEYWLELDLESDSGTRNVRRRVVLEDHPTTVLVSGEDGAR